MVVVNYTKARQNLKCVMDRVLEDVTEVIVTRQKGAAVVMVSLAKWNSINETLHLLSSRKNAQRLHESIIS